MASVSSTELYVIVQDMYNTRSLMTYWPTLVLTKFFEQKT